MDEDIDKTGYFKLKTEAIIKAFKLCNITEVTIGPDACSSNTKEENFSRSPSPPKFSRKTPTNDNNFIDNSTIIDEDERLCAKKLLADLNNFCIRDGQRVKFNKLRKHLDELERAKDEADCLIAGMNSLAISRKQEIEEKVNYIQKQLVIKQQEIASESLPSETSKKKLMELKKQEEELTKQMKEKALERKNLYDSIYKNEVEFKNAYSEILDLIKHFKEKKQFLQFIMPDVELARKINGKFISLIEHCKDGEIKPVDVTISSSLLKDILTINFKIKKEKEKYEIKEKIKQELKVQEIEKIQEKINIPETKDVQATVGKKTSQNDYLEKHKSLMEYLTEVEEKLKPFISDETYKKYRSDCQKAVNLPVNAISPCSATHLTDKLKKLTTLLQGQYVSVADARVSANNHPLGVIYCTNLLAQKIVKQGEQVVSSKPDAAYAIAAVTVAVWMEFPDFGKLLLAHFFRRCPYLVPIYWEREDGQTDEEYNKKLGFNYSNGTIEELNMFLKRQGGIVKLYSSIMITDKKKALQMHPHPHDIREGWRFLVAFVTLEPKPEISPTVLFDILEVIGYAMIKTYGIQFRKLLHVVCKSYLPKVVEVTTEGMSGGPISRLKNFLESLADGKELQPPKGLLPPNFW